LDHAILRPSLLIGCYVLHCPLQPDWSLLNAMVSKLGPRLVKIAPIINLHLDFSELPDAQQAELQDLMTARILQLIQRLEPLGSWRGAGIQNVSVRRVMLGVLELQALGAALGRYCTSLTASGLPLADDTQAGDALQDQACKEVCWYFPRLARSTLSPASLSYGEALQWTAAVPDPDDAA
jgi:hypothetical protein